MTDVEWLARAGAEGWIVLMKDERIRYRDAERSALIRFRVRAFALTRGNLRAAEMAEQYLLALPAMTDACRRPGPFLYAVSTGGIRLVDVS